MNSNIRILLMDDVHLEGRPPEMCISFAQKIKTKIQDLKKSNLIPIVICAGDIGEGVTGIEWAKAFECDIVYVCGNHEFWGQDYFEEIKNIKDKVKLPGYEHIHFLYNETKVLHGVRFVGTTLWTNLGQDYNWTGKNYIIKYYAAIGDFKRITAKQWYTATNTLKLKTFLSENGVDEQKIEDVISNKLFNPVLELEENNLATNYLKNELAQKFDGKTVVVTHHLPFRQPWIRTFKMNEDSFTKEIINDEKTFLEAAKGNMHSSKDLLMMGFYSNNLKSLLGASIPPDYWVHGHLHQPVDDLIGKTKVISCPVGYLRQSQEMTYKEFSPSDNKKDVINFIRKEIELYAWNSEILDNLRGFEKIIVKYEEIIRTGLASTETFQIIAQAFVHNHEYAKKEIEKKTLHWLSMFYHFQQPDKITERYTEDLKEDIGFNAFMKKQVDKKSKKIFSLSMGVNHYSFLPEEKFNELNKNGPQVYHYKHWLKELNLAQLNVNLYKKTLLEFCNQYEKNN
jgi:Calcineurin-like phosphoesterase